MSNWKKRAPGWRGTGPGCGPARSGAHHQPGGVPAHRVLQPGSGKRPGRRQEIRFEPVPAVFSGDAGRRGFTCRPPNSRPGLFLWPTGRRTWRRPRPRPGRCGRGNPKSYWRIIVGAAREPPLLFEGLSMG